jgi:hypothetical protein
MDTPTDTLAPLLGATTRRDAGRLHQVAAWCGAYADELAQGDPGLDGDQQIEREWDRWTAAANALSVIADSIDRQYRTRAITALISAARAHLIDRSEATSVALDQQLVASAEALSGRPITDRAGAILALLGEQP